MIASRDLRVSSAEVGLAAPDEVAIASSLVVGWTGPGERYDEVQVHDPADRGGRGKVIDNKRVNDGGDPDPEPARRRKHTNGTAPVSLSQYSIVARHGLHFGFDVNACLNSTPSRDWPLTRPGSS